MSEDNPEDEEVEQVEVEEGEVRRHSWLVFGGVQSCSLSDRIACPPTIVRGDCRRKPLPSLQDWQWSLTCLRPPGAEEQVCLPNFSLYCKELLLKSPF